MRTALIAAAAAAIGLTAHIGQPAPAVGAVAADAQRQLVPAYFYPDLDEPGSRWSQMCDGQDASQGSVVIFNPANGPGPQFNADYARVLQHCRTSGQRVIGYVHTTYGQRGLNKVKADVDAYYARYADVDGIFIDEMSNDPLTRRYYKNLYAHIKAKSTGRRFVVGNPGAAAATGWQLGTPVADNVVVFEGSLDSYQEWSPPAWTTTADPSRISHLVHGAVASDGLSSACAAARERNAGLAYVTDDLMPNPWDTLPTYWQEQPSAC